MKFKKYKTRIGENQAKKKADEELEQLIKLANDPCIWISKDNGKQFLIKDYVQREHNSMPGWMVSWLILQEAGAGVQHVHEVELKTLKRKYERYSKE